jgi:hypothetical protein
MTSYVVRTKSDHSLRRLVDTFLFLPNMTSYCVSITEQTTIKCNLFVKYTKLPKMFHQLDAFYVLSRSHEMINPLNLTIFEEICLSV